MTSKKIPLTQKFEVTKHLDNLERRYGIEYFKSSKPLEDFVNPLDADYLMIMAYRNALGGFPKSKGGRSRYIKIDPEKIELRLLKNYTIKQIAQDLGVAPKTIYKHIDDDKYLSKLFYGTSIFYGRQGT